MHKGQIYVSIDICHNIVIFEQMRTNVILLHMWGDC